MRKSHPEANLQVMVNKFVREVVPEPHLFWSSDRHAKTSKTTFIHEKARGILPGTPDTFLLAPNLPLIAVELKAPGNRPEHGGYQEQFRDRLRLVGAYWEWCDSVTGYGEILNAIGVVMDQRWRLIGAHHDATLSSAAIRRQEAKTGTLSKARTSKPREPRPTSAQVRRVQRVRDRAAAKGVLF